MLIDWFTVVAQIINFLVLVALLKWLLFDRIVRAMDQREANIAEQLNEAERKETEAREWARKTEDERHQLESQRQELIEQARQEAQDERRRLIRDARKKVDQMQQQWWRDVEQQQEQFVGQLSERARELLRQIVRQALTDLADADIQQATARVFLRRLARVDERQREIMEEAISDAEGRVLVASAGELTGELRHEITEALRHHLQSDAEFTFQTSPGLIAGLEVQSGGQALGWSLSHYLEQFEETMKETRDEQTGSPQTTSE